MNAVAILLHAWAPVRVLDQPRSLGEDVRRVLKGGVLAIAVACTTAWQRPPAVASFDSNGVSIQYLDQGSGDAVLLLNGFGRTLGQWPDTVLSRLRREGFRVITYDARGHGGSGKPDAPGQYGQEDVNDAIRLLRHLSIERVQLLGYSMGAAIASRIIVERPLLVRSAILGGWAVGNPVDLLSESECAAAAQELEQGQTPTALMRALTPVGTPMPPIPPAPAQLPSLESRKALAAAFLGACRTRRVTSAELARTGIPILAMVGEMDGMAPSVRTMSVQMPALKMIVIPGADHITALGDRFLEEALRFLNDHRGIPH